MAQIYPPVIACRILVLNGGLKPSLVVELLERICNRAREARASLNSLTIHDIASNQMEKWVRCLRFPFLCYPGGHGRSLNRRLKPQKVHDKLPFDSSQEAC